MTWGDGTPIPGTGFPGRGWWYERGRAGRGGAAALGWGLDAAQAGQTARAGQPGSQAQGGGEHRAQGGAQAHISRISRIILHICGHICVLVH